MRLGAHTWREPSCKPRGIIDRLMTAPRPKLELVHRDRVGRRSARCWARFSSATGKRAFRRDPRRAAAIQGSGWISRCRRSRDHLHRGSFVRVPVRRRGRGGAGRSAVRKRSCRAWGGRAPSIYVRRTREARRGCAVDAGDPSAFPSEYSTHVEDENTVALAEAVPTAHARLVALAIAELVTASWQEAQPERERGDATRIRALATDSNQQQGQRLYFISR